MARAKADRPLSEAALTVLLRERFAAPEYAFLPHVRNGTGYTRTTTRTADALAMSLWPSRGLDLHGFEIKSDRRDWLREKENPEKAEEIARFCDRWWLVVGRLDIVQVGEVPAPWGLLAPKGDKLVVVKEPAKLDALPLDRAQLAAILRRAAECVVPKADIKAELERARQVERARIEREVKDGESHYERVHKQLMDRVEAFQNASGLNVFDYRLGRIGEAVRFVVDGGVETLRTDLEAMRTRARAIAAAIDEQLGDAEPTREAANR